MGGVFGAGLRANSGADYSAFSVSFCSVLLPAPKRYGLGAERA